MIRARYQIRFAKVGLLRWISHRDLVRLWERMLRRVALPLSMTEGFHPKPRMSFPSALALGIVGEDEVAEIELAEALEPSELLERLIGDAQPGLVFRRVCRVPEGYPKAQLHRSAFAVELPEAAIDAAREAIDRLRQGRTVSVQRKERTILADVATQIPDLAVRDGQLQFTLASSRQADLRPTDVLAALGLDRLLEEGACLRRTRVELERDIEPAHCIEGAAGSNQG